MILEQEYENNNKTEKSTTNNINLRLLSHDSILWKKAAIFLLEIKIKKNEINENKINIKNKTLEYLYRLTNSTKEYWKVAEISDEKEIKQIILDYIKQFKYKIKLLIIYLGKSDDNNCNSNDKNNEDNGIDDESEENEDIEDDINMGEKSKINLNLNNNIINCSDKELNDSGFRNELFIDLFHVMK